MVRRLSIGKNNHLTCYSLAINPRIGLQMMAKNKPRRSVGEILDETTLPQYQCNYTKFQENSQKNTQVREWKT